MEVKRQFKLVLVEGAKTKACWDLVIVDTAGDDNDPMWEDYDFIITEDEVDGRAGIDFETYLYDVLQEIIAKET
jgi:hypothetical protein